ncbi:CaiB/BaiF CoA transferase family protein [Saccharopolyspora hattusasensis]|uniref:CaiB/BaiF CoA transferase family protein n=1 Tax=Saccharopolyspora hattusasensis TaxID=1128679 RepID=UPI003D97E3F2
MGGMLAGVKVVSLTHYLQGPSCVQFLADLGADVVKVERIGGAYERHWAGAESFVGDESVFFLLAGRNQRSIELDFRAEEGSKVLWRLIENADVLVENFRPGVLDNRGFSYDAVKQRNPGIIYCSLTGYGSTGPGAIKPGQDLLIQSLSGLAMLNGKASDPPTLMGTAVVDQHAAALGALGIVAALFGRNRTGNGSKVDSDLLSAALDLQIEPLNYHLNGTRLYDRSESGISSRFHQAPYGVFRTADSWITLSLCDGPALATAFSDEQFAQWSRGDQFAQREEINRRVAEHMSTKTTAEWEKVFDEVGLWYARVREYDEVEADPQIAANDSILEFDLPRAGRIRVLNHPLRYDGAAPVLRLMPPNVGEHTTEILAELGYSQAEISTLRATGEVGPDRASTPFDRKAAAPANSYTSRKG